MCQFTAVKKNTDLYGIIYIFLYVLAKGLVLPLIQIFHDIYTCLQGMEKWFAEFEASILSRKRNYEFCALKGGRKNQY